MVGINHSSEVGVYEANNLVNEDVEEENTSQEESDLD
jgi:hypothetical protein